MFILVVLAYNSNLTAFVIFTIIYIYFSLFPFCGILRFYSFVSSSNYAYIFLSGFLLSTFSFSLFLSLSCFCFCLFIFFLCLFTLCLVFFLTLRRNFSFWVSVFVFFLSFFAYSIFFIFVNVGIPLGMVFYLISIQEYFFYNLSLSNIVEWDLPFLPLVSWFTFFRGRSPHNFCISVFLT